jgi:hypothetical protein
MDRRVSHLVFFLPTLLGCLKLWSWIAVAQAYRLHSLQARFWLCLAGEGVGSDSMASKIMIVKDHEGD